MIGKLDNETSFEPSTEGLVDSLPEICSSLLFVDAFFVGEPSTNGDEFTVIVQELGLGSHWSRPGFLDKLLEIGECVTLIIEIVVIQLLEVSFQS